MRRWDFECSSFLWENILLWKQSICRNTRFFHYLWWWTEQFQPWIVQNVRKVFNINRRFSKAFSINDAISLMTAKELVKISIVAKKNNPRLTTGFPNLRFYFFMRLRLVSKVLVQTTVVLSVRYYISNSFRIKGCMGNLFSL